ncbi:DegT/DnrJ/EryC1/StrS family aminotransferase [Owenweeksia hongkongensis]|uniref:DegT/DnrJ/EryC1/StrS family aminotransferase n=1 Tax=Owenweeksia hongkongensis TaxID=253245 RepID=UPI003A904BA8
MSTEKIWLSSPHMGSNEQKFVNEAFDTNWIAPLGPHVNGFEADIQSYNHVAHAAALTSGTAAIHLSLILNEVGAGDYVLVQSFTFSATINPIIYQGAVPIFIDSEEDTWNMCPEALEEAVQNCLAGKYGEGKLPKAIIPVHLYGMPAKMDAIMKVANTHGIPVIEDAAESLGSTYHDKHTGTFGKMGIYSFNGNKIITTSGGGALVSEDADLIQKARFLATQARDDAPHYQHSHVGYNYRLSNVLAGIGRGQMQVLDDRISARRANFERYKKYFAEVNTKGYSIELQQEPQGSFSNRWLSCIVINPEVNKGLTREAVRLAMEAKNIESRPLWKPMHLQPVFEKYPFVSTGVSERLFDVGLCLPSGSNLTDEDFERIFSCLDSIFS